MGNPNPHHRPPMRGQSHSEPPDADDAADGEPPLLWVRALDPQGIGRGASGREPGSQQPAPPRLSRRRRRT